METAVDPIESETEQDNEIGFVSRIQDASRDALTRYPPS